MHVCIVKVVHTVQYVRTRTQEHDTVPEVSRNDIHTLTMAVLSTFKTVQSHCGRDREYPRG